MSSSPTQEPETLFRYRPAPGLRDETLGPSGEVRESWRYIVDSLAALGADELGERRKKALRILRDDGATYNIYDNSQADRTWHLDLVPWVIDSDEWNRIEAGLLERAELFNLLFQDIYGPRELITRGLVPPEAIFGHRGFLRPCHGIRLPGEHQLIVHAVDMVRRDSGEMCVLADRTQAPSGAGYALENRTVMSRVFPSLFRDSHVHRLSLFFQNLRHKLFELAPRVPVPQVVVLTPGPYNETYFEHAYLANYLGFPLVQSGDLEVRDGHVWMKALDGLSRVDVILRRVDDDYCDPVELKSDSRLGIPGLLEVVRRGNVAVANPLGSGVLENPVLLKYMPAISRYFLGREPRLASVATWWCREPADLEYVLANLDDLVIKPVFRAPGSHSVATADLDTVDQEQLANALRADPAGYVAQERLVPSHLPALASGEFKSRPAVLRSYAVASEASYRVMPGGLTRAGESQRATVVSSQAGSVSKDTWVLASEPEKQISLWPRDRRESLLAADVSPLPSRVVENLFWMGRYAERAECGLRLLRTVFLQTAGINPLSPGARRTLLRAVTKMTATYPGFIGDEAAERNPDEELLAVILDADRPGSIHSCVRAMLACAKEARELLSTDTQRIINDIRDQFRDMEKSLRRQWASAPEEALDPLVTSLLALSGLAHESMIRAMGWRFMDMGRRLERAMQTTTLVRALMVDTMTEGDEGLVLESLLMTVEALISYRRRYRAALDVRSVLELTLIDVSNPRAVLHQLETVQQHLEHLPAPVTGSRELTGEKRHILEAINMLKLSELESLARLSDDGGGRLALDDLFGRLYGLLAETSNTLSRNYFAHAAGPRQLVRQQWEVE